MLRDVLDQKEIAVETVLRRRACPRSWSTATRLRQVFLNVLRNAHEALGARRQDRHRLRRRSEDGGRTMVRVRISDNGPGIPEKDWENIFEPFFTTKPSGLRPRPGQRPQDRRAAQRDDRASAGSGAGAAPSSSSIPPRGGAMKSILIVEDDPLVRKTLASQLAKKGFEVARGRDGRGRRPALRRGLARTSSCCDVRLPDIDGLEVLRADQGAQPPGRHPDHDRLRRHEDDRSRPSSWAPSSTWSSRSNTTELDLTIDKAFQVRALRGEGQLPRRGDARRNTPSTTSSATRPPMRGRLQAHRLGGRHPDQRPHPGRERHGQGAGGQGHPLQQPAAGTSRSSSSTARPSRTPCSRASSSATSRAPSPTPSARPRASSRSPARARSSSTRSATSRPTSRAKLLRVIETRDFMKVGGEKVLKTEARIIAATNQNLQGPDREGPVPRGPLLPPQGRRDPPAAAARAAGGHPRPGRLPPGEDQPGAPPQRPQGPARGHEAPRRHCPGAGTSASSRTP
ncbi:MAG: ATP-binding protein [Ignavibacteriales bacterium]|nr:ATP-binding protein [Ignavibacteriales bacterium]